MLKTAPVGLSEKLMISDYKVYRWTSEKIHSQHLYFTSPSVTEDDRWLVVMQERDEQVWLAAIDRETGEAKQLSKPDRRMYAYVYGYEDRSGGFSKTSPIVDAVRNWVYWQQDDHILGLSLDDSGDPQVIAKLPGGWVSAYNHISPDGQTLVVPLTHPDAFYDGMNQDAHMKEVPPKIVNHGLCTKILLIDIASGAVRCAAEIPFWVTHAQFDPSGSGRLLMNSEGSYWMTGEPHKRIWVLETDGSFHPLFDQPSDEECSHENFSPDGSLVIYHGHRRDWSSFVGARSLDGELAWEMETPDFHPWHAIATHDEPGFTIDVADGQVLLGRIRNEILETELICNHDSSMSHQDVHAHPLMNPDGKGVVFTSDTGGCAGVYELRLTNN